MKRMSVSSPSHIVLTIAALAVLSPLVTTPAHATSFVMVTDELLADQASIIAEVEVLEIDRAPGIGEPATDYLMALDNVIVGDVSASPLTVRVRGGQMADGTELWVYGAPRFAAGQRAMVFLNQRSDGTYGILHFMLGAFHVLTVDGQKVLVRDLSETHEITLPGKASVAKGPRDLERFRVWLEDHQQGRKRAADYFVEDASGGISRELEKFTLITNPPIRFREFDLGQSIAWRADSQGQPGVSGGGFAQFRTALGAWNGDGGSNINYVYAGTTSARGGLTNFDGVNAIMFDDRGNTSEFDEPFDCNSGGVIAVGGPWFTNSTHVHNGQNFRSAIGADIVTNRNTGCFLGQGRSAEEVFSHELGHTLGFGHSADSGALMFAFAHGGNFGPALRADDRAGAAFLYGTPTVTPNSPNNLSATAISPGQVDLRWNDNANNETSYEVERQEAGGSFQRIATIGANRTTYEDTTTQGDVTYTYRVRARNSAGASGYSNTDTVTTPVPQPCVAGPNTLCLNNGRFKVEVNWRDFDGNEGQGTDLELASSDSGLMWFFAPNNWELLVKVLDGCAFTNHFWVFAAATTNVAYDLIVTDSATGFVRTYSNELGVSAPATTDTAAFQTCDVSAPRAGSSVGKSSTDTSSTAAGMVTQQLTLPEKQGVCTPDATTLCLNGGRFSVKIDWEDFDNNTGFGQVDPMQSSDSGLMYFFDPENLEVLVKVLDGCAVNNRVWVFAAATTTVRYTLEVTDTVTGAVQRYTNPLGNSSDAITDTDAFMSCP
ncbi:MAG: matrixin family metalloprotease [Acidobacteriota bacterium]